MWVTPVQISLQVPVFKSFGYVSRSGMNCWITGYLCAVMFPIRYACTILHSHQQCERVPIVIHPHQHLFPKFSFLFIVVIQKSAKRQSHFGLDLHFPNDYLCWASYRVPAIISTSCLEKELFKFFAHFLFGFLWLKTSKERHKGRLSTLLDVAPWLKLPKISLLDLQKINHGEKNLNRVKTSLKRKTSNSARFFLKEPSTCFHIYNFACSVFFWQTSLSSRQSW